MLYGRDLELAAIDAALASARDKRGRAVFFVGEAGIGKSSLLAAARERAPADALVLDGAAWESPGAPPYWPWIQVTRAAEAELGARVRELPGIAQLLGEPESAAPGIDPVAARFGMLAAVARSLVTLAAQRPLVIVLDDLHAADVPSLELLDLACREIARAAITIVGSWRDHELAARPEAARHLGRVGRDAIALRRLSADEIASWVGGADAAAIHAASEGNPLFVAELVRAHRGGVVPRAIATVLGDHVALVSAETREVLAAASVLGRDVDVTVVAAIVAVGAAERASSVASASDIARVERALREASAVGLGDPLDARGERSGNPLELRRDAWRFRHVLLRDYLYDGLPREQRIRLHRAAGEMLVRRDEPRAAHHLLAGEAPNAVAVAREAAARASALYAFEDAAALLAAAKRALETHASDDVVTRIDVMLELARARANTGAVEAMRAEATRAAELAKSIGDAERFAHAALAYGAELASGRIDPVMTELLEAACVMLPPGDGSLRARVIARLAAALVPPPDPHDTRPFELAEQALAMAERLGDTRAKMYALRFNGHAHGFRRGIDATMPYVVEAIALSEQLGCPLDVLEHRSWLANAHIVKGDLVAADGALESLATLLGRLPLPHYQWRMPMARATRATLRGDFGEAERLLAIVRAIGREHDIDRARMATIFGGISLAFASRSPAHARAMLDQVHSFVRGIGGAMSAAILASTLALSGDADAARRELATINFVPPIGLSQFALEPALLVDDRRVIAMCIEPLREAAEAAPIAYALALSLVLAPIEIAVGEGLVRLDRAAEAIAPLERGLALARKLESPPYIARGAAALAAALPARDPRVAALREDVRRNAGVDEVAPTAAMAPARGELAIARDGEQVRIAWRGRELRAPASKGLDYLQELVARPSGELHVSELVGDDDRGDAGEVLDATARAAYKARIDELRGDLADAEDRNDLARIDQLRTELEMVTAQVVTATGLGGKSRRAASRVERARVNVQRRIRDAIQRLASEDATLGRYLDATIRTGTFCSFTPLDG